VFSRQFLDLFNRMPQLTQYDVVKLNAPCSAGLLIIITGSTALCAPWPSSKPSSILPHLMPSSFKSFLLKA
jgi:hypothetical protein